MQDKVGIFNERMLEQVTPGSSAKELLEKIVRSALEVEFGSEFTLNPGFAKMVSKIADSLVTNPELRRQALSVASTFITKKMEINRSAAQAVRSKKTEPAKKAPVKVDPRFFSPNIPLNL